ncbi:5' DNA nuclease [Ciceribacter sp. L1K22]|uniref:5' DNA nuclease n=1 Tax=Ciceribacter sp. L1K22 TaxID=2820275 RepID=UPI001ABE5533|nr:5' DNA nuclease [Ciceribacter sp. L1K22]MBO3759830.1 5' DNA nuclease [Ciceribacter sp. L1K22]
MGKAKDRSGEGRPVEPVDASRAPDALPEMAALPLHPLLAHPTAAFMAATAVGFGVASQLAGVMLGAFQSAVDASNRAARDANPYDQPEAEARTLSREQERVEAQPETETEIVRAKTVSPKAAAGKTAAKTSSKPVAKPKAVARRKATRPDDLKKIAGIGPKAEQVLNARGMVRYADIAALTEAEAARLDSELGFGGRIGRDDWVGQAKTLAGGKP